jgi:hypothetical protein
MLVAEAMVNNTMVSLFDCGAQTAAATVPVCDFYYSVGVTAINATDVPLELYGGASEDIFRIYNSASAEVFAIQPDGDLESSSVTAGDVVWTIDPNGGGNDPTLTFTDDTIAITNAATMTVEDLTCTDCIGGSDIADDQIDSEHYVAGSVDLEHMASQSVDSDNIVEGTILVGDMAANSIDSDQYVDGSVDAIHLAADIIDETKIADDGIDSEHYNDGSVDAIHLANLTKSMYWGAAGMSSDGTQCADPTEVTINSGPKLYTIICTDNDAAIMNGHTVMPDGWDAGTVTFELSYIQTAADTSALNLDVSAQCHGAGETVDSTFGTEVAIDDAAVTGSNAVDATTSAAVTAAGTCAAGDILFWQIELDATGTTTAVATLHFVGVKMEYGWNPAD